jgi:hypothetical protein
MSYMRFTLWKYGNFYDLYSSTALQSVTDLPDLCSIAFEGAGRIIDIIGGVVAVQSLYYFNITVLGISIESSCLINHGLI